MIKVNSIDELVGMLSDGSNLEEFFINLGGIRSSKNIYLDEDEKGNEVFNVLNEIDDTTQILTREQLADTKYTNIGKAIIDGRFYRY